MGVRPEKSACAPRTFRGGAFPIMAYTGRLSPKVVPFSGFRYMIASGDFTT